MIALRFRSLSFKIRKLRQRPLGLPLINDRRIASIGSNVDRVGDRSRGEVHRLREADQIRAVSGPTRALRKAVILAAGRGTRMREERRNVVLEPEQSMMADRGLKAMIPFAGRPFLDYVLSALADAGYEEACLVINPEYQVLRDHYTRGTPPARISVTFAIQHMPRGTADAVLRAEPFAADDSFLMINSDNYYAVSSLAALRTLRGPGLIGFDREHLLK